MVVDTGVPAAPCEGRSPSPPYPPAGEPARIAIWHRPSLSPALASPHCTGWGGTRPTILVALSGTFHMEGGAEALLAHMGGVSRFPEILYWSVTRQRWRPLIHEAWALTGPDGKRRDDFGTEEMRSGKWLHFYQDEYSTAGEVYYRMRVRQADDLRIVVEVENSRPVRKWFLPLFGPGEYAFIHFLEKGEGDLWHYYGVMRAGSGFNPLASGHDASYANRAAALFRHLAGIDYRLPPAAPSLAPFSD